MSMISQFNTNCFGQCIEVLSLLKCVNMDHKQDYHHGMPLLIIIESRHNRYIELKITDAFYSSQFEKRNINNNVKVKVFLWGEVFLSLKPRYVTCHYSILTRLRGPKKLPAVNDGLYICLWSLNSRSGDTL